MIKLVFLDIDGTLIGKSGAVRPAVWEALDELVAKSFGVSICTGRPAGGVAGQIAARLGPGQGPHIFQGGALTCDAAGAVVRAVGVPHGALKEMVGMARAQGLTLELYTKDEIFVDQLTTDALRHTSLLGLPPQKEADLIGLAQTETILKTQWIVSHEQAKGLLEAGIPGCFQAVGMSDGMPDVTFISVTSNRVDKGKAVEAVMHDVGLSAWQCAAVGDSTGDLPMLKAVGAPFVMANSHRELLEAYPVLPGVEEDGIIALCKALG